MTSVFSWQNSIRLFPDSFCTLRPNLPVTPGVSLFFFNFFFFRYLLTSYFCIPAPYEEKDTFFLVLVLEDLVGLHRAIQLQILQH